MSNQKDTKHCKGLLLQAIGEGNFAEIFCCYPEDSTKWVPINTINKIIETISCNETCNSLFCPKTEKYSDLLRYNIILWMGNEYTSWSYL